MVTHGVSKVNGTFYILHERNSHQAIEASVDAFFFFGEIRNLTTLCLLNNNSFSLSLFFLSLISFLWIGAQFPQEKFLSYGRILTLHYYFLLMCILISSHFYLISSGYKRFPLPSSRIYKYLSCEAIG